MAVGWIENDEDVTKAYLDEICSDKPLIMNIGSGHSCLLNTKPLEWAGIDAAYAKKIGYDMVELITEADKEGLAVHVHSEGGMFDCDFLHDVIEKVAEAKLVATLVEGEEVYKAKGK